MIKVDGFLKVCGGLSIIGCTAVSAFEIEHGAHVHGEAVMNIAIEGNKIAAELESPLYNITGFEHKAESEADKKTLQQAMVKLENAESLLLISSAAKCELMDADVALAAEGAQHDDHEGPAHHDSHVEHDHDEHKAHDHHAEHKHHDEHKHDHHEEPVAHSDDQHEHKEGEEHRDIHAHYQFACENPAEITQINFALLKEFPEMQEIKVNLISDKGVIVKDLNKQNSEISI
jgi:FtsZ-interacting cell division protein YlmF